MEVLSAACTALRENKSASDDLPSAASTSLRVITMSQRFLHHEGTKSTKEKDRSELRVLRVFVVSPN